MTILTSVMTTCSLSIESVMVKVSVLLRLNDIEEALKRAAAAQKPQLMHQVHHLVLNKNLKRRNNLAFVS